MRRTHCLLLYEYKRMNCLLLVLHILLLDSAVTFLPAPVNISVISHNFNHVLHWDPGSGTPPGTQYIISKRIRSGKQERQHNSTRTSFNLKLHNRRTYFLMVQASYNQTLSPWSYRVTFTPFKDTIIDPPEVSLAGCGNCIQVNISLPKAETQVDIQKFYDASFRVMWNKTEKGKPEVLTTRNKSFTLSNLEKGVEYCVRVHWEMLLKIKTEQSPQKCTFTSHVEPENGTFLLGAVTAVLIFVLIALTMSTYCLYYTGFLCRLPAAVPRAIITALNAGYILTPERTTPCQISISSEMGKQRKYNPAISLRATGEANSEVWDDDEDDEDKIHIYLDKDRELSSGDGPCQDSGNVSGKSKPAALGDSGSLIVRPSVEVEALYTDFDQDEDKAVEAEVSLMHRGDQTGVQGQVTGEVDEEVMKEVVEMQDLSNVNLFSVTLAAFAEGDEEQQEEEQSTGCSPTDFLIVPTPDHLLPSDSKQILNHTHSQTESDNDTLLSLQTTQADIIVTGFDSRCADILLQHESTEEEEEFSAYLGHR
uniref:Fibronectin type-III domain-containing protein n=1 Tax=Amphiprion percula TaxID=161767 RepID=A0A3P8U7L4_AMPPE